MWIRSQNKKVLGNYDSIAVLGNEIRGYIFNDRDILGEYETEERATEVLDEIQTNLKNVLCNSFFPYSFIFEMPEK